MKFLLPAVAASVMLLAFSCKRNNVLTADSTEAAALQISPINKEEEIHKNEKDKPGTYNKDWDKKIIKTAILNVETKEYKGYNIQIQELVTKFEGYIARQEENENDGRINNSLTIKVPVAHFDEAVNAISSLKGKMLVKQISSEDVSGEIVDVRSRMDAKKRVRLRYLDMLQKAKNIEEILQVEREVNEIQEQIEAADGRLKYLSHTTAYSSIELSFFQALNPGANVDTTPGFAKRFLLALNEGLKWMGNLIIFFATLWPLWLIIVSGIIAVKRIRVSTVKNITTHK